MCCRSPRQYVYQIFFASVACQSLAGAVSYSYFVRMWNEHCPHVRLKKAMRFTKCDLCVLATEALDRARANGGHGWESQAMIVIKRKLEEHYRVRSLLFVNLPYKSEVATAVKIICPIARHCCCTSLGLSLPLDSTMSTSLCCPSYWMLRYAGDCTCRLNSLRWRG